MTFANTTSIDECLANTPHIIDGKEVETKKAVPKKDSNSSSPAQPKTTKVWEPVPVLILLIKMALLSANAFIFILVN